MRAVAALILAAGGSSRLGGPKQLVRVGGESLVRRAIVAAREAGCTPITVVAGDLHSEIAQELLGTSTLLVRNQEWRRGIGSSIAAGIRALIEGDEDVHFVVVIACDQPLVDGAVIRALTDQQRASGKPIVASSYANTLGIPALFDRSCFAALLQLPEDSGAKPIIEARLAEVATVAFEGGAIDIDTPADLQRLKL